MSFTRRTFPEVLDSLLTAITKGVAAEAHPFPPPGAGSPPYRHSLQQPPVAQVVSLYGSRDGDSHLFRKDVDYRLLADKQTVEWQKGADLPDPGTLLYVNYYPESAQPVLTDIQTGSVVRTLAESVALEMARLYAQLKVVYDSGFIDTAEGRSLDKVVALLGTARVRGGRPAGQVVFSRVAGGHGEITIPAGTRVITADGEVEYETVETITLAEGQVSGQVATRDLEVNDILPADSLTVLPVPIAGIESVTNPAPTAITTRDESDDELRTRAKSFLHGSERATLGAIKQAIALQGVTAEVEEVLDAQGLCRYVRVTPQAEELPPELKQRLDRAIYDSRPAGVLVSLGEPVPPRKVNLKLRLTSAAGLIEQDLRAAQRAVQDNVKSYFAKLPAKASGSINQLVGLVLSVPEIKDVTLSEATWTHDGTTESVLDLAAGQLKIGGFPTVLGELQMIDPNLPTRLSVTVTYPKDSTAADRTAIQGALNTTLSYLNGLNPAAAETAPKKVLSFGKLLYAIPLPAKPAGTLESYDAAPQGTAPALPTETSISPYKVQFVFSQESGLSRILAKAADSYTVAPDERLSLNSVEVSVEAANA